ncbi:MAG: hypothetical protein LBJ47_06570 [Tannerella sp.]|nr:hypothetical protein [Tannerella sp.]
MNNIFEIWHTVTHLPGFLNSPDSSLRGRSPKQSPIHAEIASSLAVRNDGDSLFR